MYIVETNKLHDCTVCQVYSGCMKPVHGWCAAGMGWYGLVYLWGERNALLLGEGNCAQRETPKVKDNKKLSFVLFRQQRASRGKKLAMEL